MTLNGHTTTHSRAEEYRHARQVERVLRLRLVGLADTSYVLPATVRAHARVLCTLLTCLIELEQYGRSILELTSEVRPPNLKMKHLARGQIVRNIVDRVYDEDFITKLAKINGLSYDTARRKVAKLSVECALLPPMIIELFGEMTPSEVLAHLSPSETKALGRTPTITPLTGEHVSRHFNDIATQGDISVNYFCESSLKEIAFLARTYRNQGSFTTTDLVQEGLLGVLRAIEKFDYRYGNAFKTYAVWWIKQALAKSISERAHHIRVPQHLQHALFKFERARAYYTAPTAQDPPVEYVLNMADINQSHAHATRLPMLFNYMQMPISLEHLVSEQQATTQSDDLTVAEQDQPENIACRSSLKGDMAQALRRLSRLEREVIILRYGITDGRQKTFTEIGEWLGYSGERMRQLECVALKKLRQGANRNDLRDYLA